ncbi:MAG: hypothetical protein ACP5HD_02205 [Thermoproteus sp.]
MRGQISSPVAASIFALLVAVLTLFAFMKLSSLPHGGYLAPLSPPQGGPARWIHVFYHNGELWMVDAETPSPTLAEIAVGVNGTWVATFYLWPGGYNCTYNSSFVLGGEPISASNPLRIGPDPYSGLWCPPPWKGGGVCSATVVESRGRLLLARCIP